MNPALKALQTIPGVGKEIAKDLWNIGVRKISALKDHDPESLYQQLCQYQGQHVDRCMLYVLRCAIYYASCTHHDPELLKWWNWKNRK